MIIFRYGKYIKYLLYTKYFKKKIKPTLNKQLQNYGQNLTTLLIIGNFTLTLNKTYMK